MREIIYYAWSTLNEVRDGYIVYSDEDYVVRAYNAIFPARGGREVRGLSAGNLQHAAAYLRIGAPKPILRGPPMELTAPNFI